VAPLREVDPQGLYHVMSRGNFRQRVFLGDEHYACYLRLLQRVTTRNRWTILDWCLVPNHVHLIVRLNEGGLSEGMRELNGGFSRWSNSQTGRTGTGHLWKNRFKSLDIRDDGHFWEILRYEPNNPVVAGLVIRPEDWPWSGYRATIGLEHPYAFHQPAELLRFFAVRPEVALARYKRFVQEGLVRRGHAPWSDQIELGADPGPPPSTGVVESTS
jgi:putative transposase